ncbi:MAG: SDR family NAD(P)-dependent oxidoreductase [Chloroflexi bacterium AL-W]|nr:SDR family NAD(P)-dependent oxidoreductase [Chloroflexi bacterium AL-N1]NOK68387.1 SDR family NAD(P)-dependent oxidoreductase [Chloroflexi bacterium AL-N10]NOK74033.1 SDR family NAD(P)-dependent oxidoreductase [Chloroflexi bacterium AL-N5]NOK83001.1 SDR family NAD(P)-dependent oxidoreductase [Chloroflexi bacterium AL-W]NOK90523.1 SDR family NAD(P)-dependent oxidoreductase [Chloroflexi bacterium AL-N15]
MASIRFDEQVVLVTGAGRGLGAAYAHLFAQRGATVVVHDAGVQRDGTGHDPDVAHAVATDIQAAGGTALAETQDLSTRAACEALINAVQTRCGRLDVLIHSVGLVVYKGIVQTTDEEWERQLRVNIEAPFWLCRAVWPIMQRQQYGRIVLTVSGYGLKWFADSDVTAYGVGKAAQFGLMNGLAGEGQQHGILVNAISPVAATRIFRREVAPDELRPESVAPGVVFLGSQQCTWTGKVLQIAGERCAVGAFESTEALDLGPQATPEQIMQALAEE